MLVLYINKTNIIYKTLCCVSSVSVNIIILNWINYDEFLNKITVRTPIAAGSLHVSEGPSWV